MPTTHLSQPWHAPPAHCLCQPLCAVTIRPPPPPSSYTGQCHCIQHIPHVIPVVSMAAHQPRHTHVLHTHNALHLRQGEGSAQGGDLAHHPMRGGSHTSRVPLELHANLCPVLPLPHTISPRPPPSLPALCRRLLGQCHCGCGPCEEGGREGSVMWVCHSAWTDLHSTPAPCFSPPHPPPSST